MTIEPFWLGAGAALLAGIMTFFMPVSGHKVNQSLVAAIIVVLIFISSFSMFDLTLALIVAIVSSALAIIYRDVHRFIRQTLYGVTKFSRRDYWYRRVGHMLLGARGRRNRS